MRYGVRSSCCGDQEGKISEIEFGIAFRQMTVSKFQLNFASGTNRDKASLMNRIWNKIVEVNYKSQFMFSVINGHAYLWQHGHSITASMSTVFTALEKKVFMINFL